MKNLFMLLFSFLLIFNITIDSIHAQAPYQLYLMQSIKIEPSKRVPFEKSVKSLHAALNDAKVNDIEYYVNSTNNYEYFTAIPIENMAALDKNYWAEAYKKVGKEKIDKHLATMKENMISSKMDIYVHRKDWDYKHASLKGTEMGFRKWHIYEAKEGTSGQLKGLMKEWLTLLKKYDVVRSMSCYSGIIGLKNGTLVIVMDANDEASYAQQINDFWSKTGAEGVALWERTAELLVNIEYRDGQFRPDLSMIPAPKATPAASKEK